MERARRLTLSPNSTSLGRLLLEFLRLCLVLCEVLPIDICYIQLPTPLAFWICRWYQDSSLSQQPSQFLQANILFISTGDHSHRDASSKVLLEWTTYKLYPSLWLLWSPPGSCSSQVHVRSIISIRIWREYGDVAVHCGEAKIGCWRGDQKWMLKPEVDARAWSGCSSQKWMLEPEVDARAKSGYAARARVKWWEQRWRLIRNECVRIATYSGGGALRVKTV